MATFLDGLELFKEKILAEKLAAQNLPVIRENLPLCKVKSRSRAGFHPAFILTPFARWSGETAPPSIGRPFHARRSIIDRCFVMSETLSICCPFISGFPDPR
jgi:hypothetical protein